MTTLVVKLSEVQLCSCGAFTTRVNGIEYSMSRETLERLTAPPVTPGGTEYVDEHNRLVREPNRKLLSLNDVKQTFSCCNYCVNHWGIDLCGCGSGKPFGKCDAGTSQCKLPAQSIEHGYQSLKSGWLDDGSLPSILEQTQAIRNATGVLRAQAHAAVLATDPDISDVKRISSNPNCGVVKLSALKERWDAEFYVAPEKWFQCIADLLCSDTPTRAVELVKLWRDSAPRELRDLITPQKYRRLGAPHPEIIGRLCQRFGIPVESEARPA